MDTILYSIYKIQDNKFSVEDRKNGNIYKFNKYSDVIKAFSLPNGFLFSPIEERNIISNPKCKIDIYERNYPIESSDDTKPLNNYGWCIAETTYGASSFPRIVPELLKDIQQDRNW